MLRFFTIIINHGFYKIFLILNKQLYYSQNLILKTNGTSTLLSAIGKFFGVFIEDLNKWIPVLFILNLCCLLCCFFIKNIYLFILCRNLQGFISGIQTSIAIGSSAYKGKEGFANWHTISTFVSIFTKTFSITKLFSSGKSYLFINFPLGLYLEIEFLLKQNIVSCKPN